MPRLPKNVIQYWATLLFLVYINDISNANHNSNYVLYADDTNLLLHDLDHLNAVVSVEPEKLVNGFQQTN